MMSQFNTRQLDVLNPASFFAEGAGQFIQTENVKRQIGSQERMASMDVESRMRAEEARNELTAQENQKQRVFEWEKQQDLLRRQEIMAREQREFETAQQQQLEERMLRVQLLSQELTNARAAADAQAISRVQIELDNEFGSIRKARDAADMARVTLAARLAGLDEQATERARQMYFDESQKRAERLGLVNQQAVDYAEHVAQRLISSGGQLVPGDMPSTGELMFSKDFGRDTKRVEQFHARKGLTNRIANIAADYERQLQSGKYDESVLRASFARDVANEVSLVGGQLDPKRVEHLLGQNPEAAADKVMGVLREYSILREVGSVLEDFAASMGADAPEGAANMGVLRSSVDKVAGILREARSPADAMRKIADLQMEGELSEEAAVMALSVFEGLADHLGTEAEGGTTPEAKNAAAFALTVRPLSSMATSLLTAMNARRPSEEARLGELRKSERGRLRGEALATSPVDEELISALGEMGMGDLARQVSEGGFDRDLLDLVGQRLTVEGRRVGEQESRRRQELESRALRTRPEPDLDEANRRVNEILDRMFGRK